MQSDKLRVRRRAASMLTMALALRLMMALGVEDWTARTLEAWLAPPVPAAAMAATAPEQTQEPEQKTP